MTRIVYLNGEYVPEHEAKISIFDRAVNFGDAVYDVAGVLGGKLIDFEHHMQRYFNSLQKMAIESPLTQAEILQAFRRLVELNHIEEGLVYMQVTRGVAERDFVWPDGIKPTVFMFTQAKTQGERDSATNGVMLASQNDIRWARRDIKSVNLLGQVLAKKAAHDAGAYEALMVDADGFVTECGSTSFFIIRNNQILTRALSNDILPGVTRRAIVALCESKGLELSETRFTLQQALDADEAFITGASSYILPVVQIDDREISAGKPGQVTLQLRDIYLEHVRASLI
ncbi:MAG: D-amino-acid transaminase [Gammaproteobacteria bacterium]|nr:D-amino-acid transaminase [Gammaproteobacteria bacterium]